MKKFCVLTTGRSGSTALMDSLAEHSDIGLPQRQYHCVDNELFNPRSIKTSLAYYSKQSSHQIRMESELIAAFYRSNMSFKYAGFKTMPERHRKLRLITEDKGIQVITLKRKDIYSTLASFLVAKVYGTWRREGEEQTRKLRIGPEEKQLLGQVTGYLYASLKVLDSCSQAIVLHFEDLCSPGYQNTELSEFFQRPIQLLNPRAPISGATYIENWQEFRDAVQEEWVRLGASREMLSD